QTPSVRSSSSYYNILYDLAPADESVASRTGVAVGETGYLTNKAKNASFRQKRLAEFISTRTRAGAPIVGFSPESPVSRMVGTARPALARLDVFDPRRSSQPGRGRRWPWRGASCPCRERRRCERQSAAYQVTDRGDGDKRAAAALAPHARVRHHAPRAPPPYRR